MECQKKIKRNYETDLQNGINNKFNNLLQSKIVEQDFPEIMKAIKQIHNDLDIKLFSNDSLKNKVSDAVEAAKKESENLLFIDPILDVYSKFNRTPDLNKQELEILKNNYNDYLEHYKEAKDSVKEKFAFPGCNEVKDTDKHGDFIIFNEILKFMKCNKSDAVLLTRDVTKSDWIKNDRSPFLHYILKAFQLTGQILYIFDATDFLSLISFENIYKINTPNNNDIRGKQDREFYRLRFLNNVTKVKEYFESKLIDVDNLVLISDRSSLGHNFDLVGLRETGHRIGILVYVTVSKAKGFQKNIQKRINNCNKAIAGDLSDEVILTVIVKDKSLLSRLKYEHLETNYRIRIVVFYCQNINDPELELIEEFEIR